jgi:hypothetical protein
MDQQLHLAVLVATVSADISSKWRVSSQHKSGRQEKECRAANQNVTATHLAEILVGAQARQDLGCIAGVVVLQRQKAAPLRRNRTHLFSTLPQLAAALSCAIASCILTIRKCHTCRCQKRVSVCSHSIAGLH